MRRRLFSRILQQIIYTHSVRLQLIAHRGASAETPENTMAAFRRAVQLKADAIELDIRFSRDHRAIVIHDETVDRTTNGQGPVWNFSARELLDLDAGSWFHPSFANEKLPLLEKVFSFFRKRDQKLLVEIKSPPYVDSSEQLVCDMIRHYAIEDRAIVLSFDHHVLWRTREIQPHIQTGVLIDFRAVDPVRAAMNVCARVVAVRWNLVDAELVHRAHLNNLAVLAWTVNRPEHARKLLSMKVDGIITDNPGMKSFLRS